MSLLRSRKTKIVATLGPASSDPAIVKQLLLAGVDVFRLNFSHGAHEEHKARYDAVRAAQEETGLPVSVLADMQGPKLRLGVFEDGKIMVEKGHRMVFDLDKTAGNHERVNLPHPEIIAALRPGERVLVDDGKVQLKVLEARGESLVVEVLAGKKLSDRKGFNVPDTDLRTSPLTEKDRRDLPFALDIGVDWIALSFVQRPEDIIEGKELIAGRAKVVAKIEKPLAVVNLEGIIRETDGIMLARGDLGVEMPAEKVPVIQKRIVRMAREAGKPLIIATQMLESMIESPSPTRAEASDVATAIYDGADAVMLSAETAAGQYPMEAVNVMNNVAMTVETDSLYRPIMDGEHPAPEKNAAGAITAAAYQVAKSVDAKLIINYTTSGSTTLRTVRERPDVPILSLTTDPRVAQALNMSYGVRSYVIDTELDRFSDMVDVGVNIARELGIVKAGQSIVITAGVPFAKAGTTNILRIVQA